MLTVGDISIWYLAQNQILNNKRWIRETACAPYFREWVITGRRGYSLRWRHNDRDGVSNHQPHDYLCCFLFRRRSKETSKLRVTGLCTGNSPVTGEFPAQKASNAGNVSIWWRHYVLERRRFGCSSFISYQLEIFQPQFPFLSRNHYCLVYYHFINYLKIIVWYISRNHVWPDPGAWPWEKKHRETSHCQVERGGSKRNIQLRPRHKLPPFHRRHFQMYFLKKKCMNFS